MVPARFLGGNRQRHKISSAIQFPMPGNISCCRRNAFKGSPTRRAAYRATFRAARSPSPRANSRASIRSARIRASTRKNTYRSGTPIRPASATSTA